MYKKKELKKAKPALDAAREAIWRLDKTTIAELRSYKSPPLLVKMTMESVMILLGRDFDWSSAKRTMAGADFKNQLRDLDPKSVTPKITRFLVKEFLEDPQFTPKNISQVSVAAGTMCVWVRAITIYCQIMHEVSKRVDKKVKQSVVSHASKMHGRMDDIKVV